MAGPTLCRCGHFASEHDYLGCRDVGCVCLAPFGFVPDDDEDGGVEDYEDDEPKYEFD